VSLGYCTYLPGADYFTGLTPGTTVWIRVWGAANYPPGTFDICIVIPTLPVNDDPCNAQSVPVGTSCSLVNYSFSFATPSGVAWPGCGYSPINDAWYSATVPASGNLVIDMPAGSPSLDAAVYQGSCNSLSLIACEVGGSSVSTQMPGFDLTGLTPGATIWIRVWANPNAFLVNFDMCIYEPGLPPINDDCGGAIGLPVSPANGPCTTTSVTFQDATFSSSAGLPSCYTLTGNSDDLWYSFVAPASGDVSVGTLNSTAPRYIAVYSGSCGVLTEIGCVYSFDPSMSTAYTLIPGQTYYVRITTQSLISSMSTDICIQEVGPCGTPINQDYCSAPAILTQGTGTFSSNTSGVYTEDQPANLLSEFCGSIENNSWYEFTALSTTETFDFTVSNCVGGSNSIQAVVYDVTTDANGCCTNFTQMSNCDGNMPTGSIITATGLTIGNTYMLMVDGTAGAVCDFTVANWTATGIILPIELVSFDGVTLPQGNELRWSTATEQNNDYFIVSRSYDGINFETVEVVQGSGHSLQPLDYSILDENIRYGIAYYRLEQVDFDGTKTEFKIIALNRSMNKSQLFYAWPNPFEGNLNITINDGHTGGTLTVLDCMGKVVLNYQLNATANSFSTSDFTSLSAGYYTLNYISSNGEEQNQKIIKK
jgi:hypothetical protein